MNPRSSLAFLPFFQMLPYLSLCSARWWKKRLPIENSKERLIFVRANIFFLCSTK